MDPSSEWFLRTQRDGRVYAETVRIFRGDSFTSTGLNGQIRNTWIKELGFRDTELEQIER